MEETEMSVVLADPLISSWRGQPGTSQNELIASTSLWTTDSPPGAMTLPPSWSKKTSFF